MQQEGGGHLVHFVFAFVAADLALNHHFIGLQSGEAFVAHFNGNRDGISQYGGEGLGFLGGGTVGAVHVAREADEHEVDFLLDNQLIKPREKIGKGPGDTVSVTVERDNSVRTVEVPPELQKLLKKEGLLPVFEKLSYTHRKEYCRWITEAKKEETRQRTHCRIHGG